MTALKLIKEHGSIEEILKHLDPKKFPVAEDWNYKGARALFLKPEVTPPDELKVRAWRWQGGYPQPDPGGARSPRVPTAASRVAFGWDIVHGCSSSGPSLTSTG